jgi:neuromedin U receptor 1
MTTANLTETEYLNYILGPRYLPLDVTIPLTLVYVIIFVCGIFGNIITCIVIIKNTSMQNATNFYLFSLAVSDLMLLILGMYYINIFKANYFSLNFF